VSVGGSGHRFSISAPCGADVRNMGQLFARNLLIDLYITFSFHAISVIIYSVDFKFEISDLVVFCTDFQKHVIYHKDFAADKVWERLYAIQFKPILPKFDRVVPKTPISFIEDISLFQKF
jgi:hypothetical protein